MYTCKKRVIVALCVLLGLCFVTSFAVSSGQQPEQVGAIDWNKPVPWVERLTAEKYILPEGWEEATKGVTQISYLNTGDMQHDIATQMNIMKFEELTGIKVVPVIGVGEETHTKTTVAMVTKDPELDIGLIMPTITFDQLAASGWLEPLDDIYPPEVVEIYGTALLAMRDENHWWGAPYTCGTQGTFYRPSWLKNAGVAVPKSWQELTVAVQKVDQWAERNLGEGHYGIVFPGMPSDLSTLLLSMVNSQGGHFYLDGDYKFDEPEFKNAFKMLVDFVRNGQATTDVFRYAYAEGPTEFGSGKAGFVLHASTAYCMMFPVQFPELEGDDWDIIPPLKWQGQPGEYGAAFTTASAMCIGNFKPDNVKAAAKLLMDFFRSKEATRNELVVEGNAIWYPPNYTDPQVCEKADWELADKAAALLGIPPRERVESIPKAEARAILSANGQNEPVGVHWAKIVPELAAVFADAASNRISVDEAISKLVAFSEQDF